MTKLHLGCGPIHIDGWINVDKESCHKTDIQADYLDILKRIEPVFDVEATDLIYSCHSIEHLEWPTGVVKFFDVAHTLLKPGGTLRIVVPDLMKVAKLYVAGDDLKGIYGPDFHIDGPDCAATRFMAFARGWEHTVLFDENLLRILATEAGFVNFRVMPFGESEVPELNGLDRFASESLSAEMDKP